MTRTFARASARNGETVSDKLPSQTGIEQPSAQRDSEPLELCKRPRDALSRGHTDYPGQHSVIEYVPELSDRHARTS